MFYKKMIFVLVLLTLVLCNSYSISAFQGEVNINSTNINIYDEEVVLEINIYNNTNISQLYNLNPHISPFNYLLERNSFRLEPKESGVFKLTLLPLNNSNIVSYKGTLELKSNSLRKNISLNIVQNNNRTCDIKFTNYIKYDSNINKYVANFNFKNNSRIPQEIVLLNINNTNISKDKFQNYRLNYNESKEVTYVFDSDSDNINVDYICNYVNKNKIIDLPKKIKFNDNNNTVSGLSGFVNLFSFDIDFNNSIFTYLLYIFLIFVLVVLVLSFATKYIKYIYNK